MSRIPLILTCHPSKTPIKQNLLDNLKVIRDNHTTRYIFPQPQIAAFQRDSNLQTSFVHKTEEKKAATSASSYPWQHPYFHIISYFQWSWTPGAKGLHNHQIVHHLLVLWSNLQQETANYKLSTTAAKFRKIQLSTFRLTNFLRKNLTFSKFGLMFSTASKKNLDFHYIWTSSPRP